MERTGRTRKGTLYAGIGGFGEFREQNKIPAWKGIEEFERVLGNGNIVYNNLSREDIGKEEIELYIKSGINPHLPKMPCCSECNILISKACNEREHRLDNGNSAWLLDSYYLEEKNGKYYVSKKNYTTSSKRGTKTYSSDVSSFFNLFSFL